MREKLSETKFMNVLCEASFLVRQIAAPETGKRALLKAHVKLRPWSYSRVKDIYYADRRVRVTAEEIDTLREIANAPKEESHDPSIRELRQQLQVVVAYLKRIDPSFHHPSIEALCEASYPNGGKTNNPGRTVGRED